MATSSEVTQQYQEALANATKLLTSERQFLDRLKQENAIIDAEVNAAFRKLNEANRLGAPTEQIRELEASYNKLDKEFQRNFVTISQQEAAVRNASGSVRYNESQLTTQSTANAAAVPLPANDKPGDATAVTSPVESSNIVTTSLPVSASESLTPGEQILTQPTVQRVDGRADVETIDNRAPKETFSGTATAATAEAADALAKEAAKQAAVNNLGTSVEFSGVDEVYIKSNSDGTWTAKYKTSAQVVDTNTEIANDSPATVTENLNPAVVPATIPITDAPATVGEDPAVTAFAEQSRIEAETRYDEAATATITDGPATVGEDPAVTALDEESRKQAEERYDNLPPAAFSVPGSVDRLRPEGAAGVQRNIRQQEDWRLRLKLAPKAENYLYNAAKQGDILYPLKATDGVVFPYTPQIAQNYRANYDASDITHTNYKQYFYKNSSVEEISITAEFTAQDTTEALYMLAVMHFFKSVTKMFYGKDENPRAGTPPPLCYLLGYGQYQFSDHPLVISGFSFTLPNDVDYIRAGSTTQWAGQNVGAYGDKSRGYTGASSPGLDRLFGSGLKKGGISSTPSTPSLSNSEATYVPTKIQFTINALPVATRAEVSNTFSLKEYASGNLLKKGFW